MRAILTYHSIDATGSVISVSPAEFESNLRALESNGVTVLPLPDLLRHRDERHAVAITFDDAYTNFESDAWPRLKERGFAATLFVPTGFVGRENNWDALPGRGMPSLPILGWPALGRLRADGVLLGAHTRSHPDLRKLDGTALEDEIAGSCEDLRRETGTLAESFAYPYGFHNPAAVARVKALCRTAVTTELRVLNEGADPHRLPRLDAFYLSGRGRLETFGSRSFQAYIALRFGVRALRQGLNRAFAGRH